MKIKAITFLIVTFFILAILPGCSSEQLADPDGNMLAYSIDDIRGKGFFIKNNDYYHPVFPGGHKSFVRSPRDAEQLNTRYLLLYQNDHLIPVITDESMLVYIDDSAPLPDTLAIEKYEVQGYTIGTNFIKQPEYNALSIKAATDLVENSSIEEELSNEKNLSLLTFERINDVSVASAELDINGIITNLEEDAKYMFSVFRGTQYYVCTDYIEVPSRDAILRTKNGFAIIALPAELESGYYLINGQGLFFYDKENAASQPTFTPEEAQIRRIEETKTEQKQETDDVFENIEIGEIVPEDVIEG